MDARLRGLAQALRREPSSPELQSRMRAALTRLADLGDAEAWGRADPTAQDLVVHALGALLGEAFSFEGLVRYEAGGCAHRVGAFRHRRSGVLLQLVPGGRFRMGTPPERGGAEYPVREVRVPPLLLGRYPVLQSEWDTAPGEDQRSWKGGLLPIEGVSWHAARAWLERLGDGLRLPSEAEWEYACRAGTRTRYFWGERMDRRYCWFGEPAEVWTTHPPVDHAEFPNAFGLVDMSGNVCEWCQDTYGPYDPRLPADGSPREGWSGMRVVRGGDGFNPASYCRSAYRNGANANDRGAGIGFRVARAVPLWERGPAPDVAPGGVRALLRRLLPRAYRPEER